MKPNQMASSIFEMVFFTDAMLYLAFDTSSTGILVMSQDRAFGVDTSSDSHVRLPNGFSCKKMFLQIQLPERFSKNLERHRTLVVNTHSSCLNTTGTCLTSRITIKTFPF